MADQLFKPGDIVQLKSGGPKMTVRNYSDDTIVMCEWFADNKIFAKDFVQDSLKIYESTVVAGPIYSKGSRRDVHY